LSGAPVRHRVVVRGRVQGVCFRDSVRRQALDAGVAGWVETRPDGAVEAVGEGAADAVRRMVEFCRRGPPQAEVLDVECYDEAPEGISGFGVR
jgi:acylphosphatase